MSALTPEEWKDGEFESRYGNAETSAQKDYKGRWFFRAEHPNGHEVVILNESHTPDVSKKLAALALAGEEFGFTREDVALLRGLALYDDSNAEVRSEYKRLESLAARIEALLPPEDIE